MPLKIYISSTFRDLEDYRGEMIRTLTVLEKNGFFELVRLMEHMVSGSEQPPLAECRQFVDSCDIYILIIGKRYGSVDEESGLSFTENEYREAVLHNKIILPFIAGEEAEGLAGVPVDNPREYQRFKGLIQNKYKTFVHPFLNKNHLSTQVVLALFKYSEKKMTTRPEVKYYCDRTPQYYSFIAKKRKDRLNVFTLVCKREDMPDYFAQRMAFYEFGMPQGYLKDPIRYSMIKSLDYEHNRVKLISHILDQFWEDGDSDRPLTVKECLQYFKQNKVNDLFIRLFLTKADIQRPGLKRTMELFLQELGVECAGNNITIYYIIVFQFMDDEPVDSKVSQWIIRNKKINAQPVNVCEIEELAAIVEEDVRDWLDKFVLDPNRTPVAVKNAVTAYLRDRFRRSAGVMTMDQTFDLLAEILNVINENT